MIIGYAELGMNLLCDCKMQHIIAVIPMKNKNGNIIRAKFMQIEKYSFVSSNPGAMIFIKNGMKISAIAEKNIKNNPKIMIIFPLNS